MSRGTQKTGGRYRRQKNRHLVRKSKQRKERTTLLIICEGETERNYFDAIGREDDSLARSVNAVIIPTSEQVML